MSDKNNSNISRILQVLEDSKDYIVNGQDIPNEFCRILFPPAKRECELLYYGKESNESIISNVMTVPLQQDAILPKNANIDKDEWVNKLINIWSEFASIKIFTKNEARRKIKK